MSLIADSDASNFLGTAHLVPTRAILFSPWRFILPLALSGAVRIVIVVQFAGAVDAGRDVVGHLSSTSVYQ
jgi:hypothetical protein